MDSPPTASLGTEKAAPEEVTEASTLGTPEVGALKASTKGTPKVEDPGTGTSPTEIHCSTNLEATTDSTKLLSFFLLLLQRMR
mgnify:FL=1